MDNDFEKTGDPPSNEWWFWIVVVAVFVTWGTNWWLLGDDPHRGTFGDMFGGVNALFSGLAFLGVIYAILLQRKELRLQRLELRMTRRELEGQRKALSTHSDTAKKQNFESTFFQLLQLYNQIIESMDIEISGRQVTGRDCFGFLRGQLHKMYVEESQRFAEATPEEKFDSLYILFYAKYQSEIGHYFRIVYNIVKFVDNSDSDDKKFYTNLLRAQLSSMELILLFYNCLSYLGNEKFKPLIEKYALLKNVSQRHLIREDDVGFYKNSAYK